MQARVYVTSTLNRAFSQISSGYENHTSGFQINRIKSETQFKLEVSVKLIRL